jgi:hypothetical protein
MRYLLEYGIDRMLAAHPDKRHAGLRRGLRAVAPSAGAAAYPGGLSVNSSISNQLKSPFMPFRSNNKWMLLGTMKASVSDLPQPITHHTFAQ